MVGAERRREFAKVRSGIQRRAKRLVRTVFYKPLFRHQVSSMGFVKISLGGDNTN